MVLGSSTLSAYWNAIPGSWRKQTHRIGTASEVLLLPVVDDGDAVRHEVKNHGVTKPKEASHATTSSHGIDRSTYYKL
jgi:hypothetical protein